ncbi:MAG: aldo/keto reductase [Bacteroidales bacterium]|nr:aldo/keto reductase [Bacteroidales bacterium]
MEYREFGNSGLKVSLLGFGAGHIGSPEMNETTAEKLLNQVLDQGINLIDTARSYGESERRIGQYVGHRRRDFIISTKVGYTFGDKSDWSYEATMGTVDEALKKLKSDYIDIVHLHSCEKQFLEQGEAIVALEKAKEQGKVRVIAYSGENDALSYAIESSRFGSIQCSVNIFDQRVVENQLPKAFKKGMGIIAKRPIANAVWRYPTRPEGHSHAIYWDRKQQMKINLHSLDWNELALRFAAFIPEVSTIIAGTSDINHLKKNLNILKKGPLDQEILSHIRSEFSLYGQNWEGLI